MRKIKSLEDVNWSNPNKSKRKPGSGQAHTKIWETQDGRRIRVCDMDDQHLLNTIKFIPNAVERIHSADAMHIMDVSACELGDTEAGWQLERHAMSMLEGSEESQYQNEIPSIWYDMVEEAEQRALINECDLDVLASGRRAAKRKETNKELDQIVHEAWVDSRFTDC